MLTSHRLWGNHNCGCEDVLNVPLLVRHPGHWQPAIIDSQVMLIDFLPTCLDAVSTALEAGTGYEGYRHVAAEGWGSSSCPMD